MPAIATKAIKFHDCLLNSFCFQESCAQKNCKSVKQLMDTWTLQMNYPVLHITKKDGNKYTVSQERFLYDRKANVTSKYKSPFE